MNGKHFAQRMGSKRNLLALLATSAIFTAGCSNMVSTAPTAAPQSSSSGQLSGTVHGGSQPVAFATVTLYYAGQSGIGSGDPSTGGPAVAAVTTSADDGHGSFSFIKSATAGQPPSGNTFSCPTAGDPLVYVVARGGNTLNTHDASVNNAASVFLAVFGLCSNINASSFVSMTEVTTVASMAALQQYFNPVTESIGADGIGIAKTAITNSLLTISDLADVAHGTAVSSKVVTGNVGPTSVTVTPQTAKVNALANIIAACINNASASATPCTTLFSNATPPDPNVTSQPPHTPPFSQATDVLQALYYILTNPTNGSATNLQNLFNLTVGIGSAFQPTLTSAPSDWTVAVNYNSTATCGSGGGNFISGPQDLNLDQWGNVWIANGQTNGNMSVISPGGAPLVCVSFGGGSRGGPVLDTLGNGWYASRTANKIVRFDPYTLVTLEFPTPAAPLALFADGGDPSNTSSNIYFTTDTGTSLYMIPHGASATSSSAPVQISSVVGPNPIHVMVDPNHAIWVSSGSNFVSRVVAGASGDPNYLNGYSTTQFTTPTDSYGLTVTSDGSGVYVTSTNAESTISLLAGSGTNYSMASGWPTANGFAGLSNPTTVALDGRSNIWTANTGGSSSLTELTSTGAALFPNGLQLDSNYLSVGRSIVIDQSGNVWIANEGTTGGGTSITEIIGAAVPVYQPYSLGLTNFRFQTVP